MTNNKQTTFRGDDIIKEYISYCSKTGSLFWIKSPANKIKPGEIVNLNDRGYRSFKLKRKTYLGHRVAWFLHHGFWPKNQIDHINGVRSDNKIINLRESTHAENNINRSCHRNGKLPGTTFFKKRNKWVAQIEIKGINKKYIGIFNSEKEAHEAYLKVKEKFYEKL